MLKMVRSPRCKIAVVLGALALVAVGGRLLWAQVRNSAEATSEISNVDNGNRVTCKSSEKGPVPRVNLIIFVGGSDLANPDRLRSQIATTPISGGSGTYNEAVVDADVKKLEDYFVASGYRFAKVTRKLIFSQDRQKVDVVFNIHEGPKVEMDVFDTAPGLVTVQYTESQPSEPAKTQSNQVTCATNEIAQITIEGNKNIPSARIMNYLLSNQGMPFDKTVLAEDLQRLKDAKLFQNVQVDCKATDDGVVVAFLVEEFPVIEEVRFDNAFHLNDQQLRRLAERAGVKQNVGANAEANRRVCRSIKERLVADGYHWAKVTVKHGNDATDTRVVFDVDEGPLVHIRTVNFAGNNNITGDALRAQVENALLGAKSVLRPAVLENIENKLKDHYRSRGYRSSQVEHTVSFDHAYDEADVLFRITEGKENVGRGGLGNSSR